VYGFSEELRVGEAVAHQFIEADRFSSKGKLSGVSPGEQ